MTRRILVVEDNADIGTLLMFHLKDLGFSVVVERSGDSGLARASRETFDLLILDLMLPGMEGLEICRALRSQSNRVPIMMLTARSSEIDRVLGLEMGADDYLTKPFSVMELCARVKALFRRIDMNLAPMPEHDLIQLQDISIDLNRHEVMARGERVALTAKEFDLLLFLARHPGRVFTRAQLLEDVWGYGHDGYDHTVNSHINRLRGKIEPDPANPHHILTVWSIGYKFRESAARLQ